MEPKVLVISRDSWNNTNNSGNTLSNIFQGWDPERIANLYCRDEIPENDVCTKYYKISESEIILNFLGKNKTIGKQFDKQAIKVSQKGEPIGDVLVDDLKKENVEKKIYDYFRKNRWHIFLWARELIWKVGGWNNKNLDEFISDFEPDIIYSPTYDSFYMHSILKYVHSKTNAKIVLFHCDDYGTYRQFSYSPFFWINRFMLVKNMKQSISLSDKNYCIVDEQSKIYKQIFNADFGLLYKTGDFKFLDEKKVLNAPLKIVYTGNIIHGRWKSLAQLGNAIDYINKNGVKAILYIYTANTMSDNIAQSLHYPGSVKIMGKVPYTEIPSILSNADILVHVESFERQEMYATSLSFSTKLVDYFMAGRCIFAIGWEKSSSISYLSENKAGVVVNNYEDILKKLSDLIDSPDDILRYGKKAWEVGSLNHSKNVILGKFRNDLVQLKSIKDI